MFITTKRVLLLLGCLIIIGGVLFSFYQQNKTDPETIPDTIEVYNVPKPLPKQDSPAKASPARADQDEASSILPSQIEHVQQISDTDKEQPVSHTASSPKDDVLSDEAIKKWVDDIMEEMDLLDARFLEKYPKLFEISKMTKNEFFEKYPTIQDQNELREYVKRVQPEMLAAVKALFSSIPIEIVDAVLLDAKDHFVKMWGQETANLVIQQLRTELGL